MTTRRERKELEAQQQIEDAQLRRKRRVARAITAAGVALTLVGGIWTAWEHIPHGADSAAARRDPAGKSLDEVQKDLQAKELKAKKTKEWIWAENGDVGKVIDEYRGLTGNGSHPREERIRLINTLARTVKPRNDWPKDFDDGKAQSVVSFLGELIADAPGPGGERVSAVNALAAYGEAIPELKPKVERLLIQDYAVDTRPGPRGDVVMSLAKMGSREGFPKVLAASRNDDSALVRASLYALSDYVGGPLDKPARKALLEASLRSRDSRPLGTKLLAMHKDPRAADLVPKLLTDDATAPEIEAGVYAVGALKLKKLKPLLIERSAKTKNPYLRQAIDSAMQSLN